MDIAAIDLTNEQRETVNAAIANAVAIAKQETEEEAAATLENAIADAKVNFKSSVVGCKKPEQYDSQTKNITKYLASWDPFRKTMNLSGNAAVSTFLTYLDDQSRNTAIAQGLDEEEVWDQFKVKLTELLSTPSAGVEARYQLMGAKQKHSETVTEFVQRLMELGDLGFKENQNVTREYVLKDALSRGLHLSHIAEKIIDEPTWSFEEAYKYAIRRDAAHWARQSLTESQIEVSVLKTEETRTFETPTHTDTEPLCYRCFMTGHTNAQCSQLQRPEITCHYCHKKNHFAKHCRSRLRDQKMRNQPSGYGWNTSNYNQQNNSNQPGPSRQYNNGLNYQQRYNAPQHQIQQNQWRPRAQHHAANTNNYFRAPRMPQNQDRFQNPGRFQNPDRFQNSGRFQNPDRFQNADRFQNTSNLPNSVNLVETQTFPRLEESVIENELAQDIAENMSLN